MPHRLLLPFSPQHRLLPLTSLPSLATIFVPSPLVYHVVAERSNAIDDNPFVYMRERQSCLFLCVCPSAIRTGLRTQSGDQVHSYQDVLFHADQDQSKTSASGGHLAQAQSLPYEASEQSSSLPESYPTIRSSALPGDVAAPQRQSLEDVLILENGVPCFISGEHWAWMAEEVRRTMNPYSCRKRNVW
jgi:hypothetical protein